MSSNKKDDKQETTDKKSWFNDFSNRNLVPFGGDYLDENRRLVFNNRLLLVIIPTLGAIIIVLLIIMGIMFLNSRTAIMLPPYDTFNISKSNADKTYYQMWGEWLTMQVGNVNESNVESNIQSILRFFDVRSLSKNKQRLRAYQDAIKSNRVSQVFTFNSSKTLVDIDDTGTKAKVTILGIAEQTIDERTKLDKKCRFQMTFQYVRASIFITGFATDCFAKQDVREQKSKEELNEEIYKQKDSDDTSKLMQSNVIKKETIQKTNKVLPKPQESEAEKLKKNIESIQSSFVDDKTQPQSPSPVNSPSKNEPLTTPDSSNKMDGNQEQFITEQ